MVPTRAFPGNLIFAILVLGAMAIFIYDVSKLVRILLLGQKEERFDSIGTRITSLIVYVFGQKRVLNYRSSGMTHFTIFWGFVILTIGTTEMLLNGFHESLSFAFLGGFHSLLTLLQDLLGLLVMIAIVIAAVRRYLFRPKRLEGPLSAHLDAGIIFALIFVLMLTMLISRGAEIVAGEAPEKAWMPISTVFAGFFGNMDAAAVYGVHGAAWWTHLIFLLGFLVYIPHSKHLHLLGAIPNVFFRSLEPNGALSLMDLEDEEAESFGVTKIEDYTWKQLLDLYACTECGRCQDQCPAFASEKPLSPKKVIHDLRVHLLEKGRATLAGSGNGENGEEQAEVFNRALVGDIILEDELWACTTCRGCQEICPVFIEHVSEIVDMRRNMVLMESQFPSEVAATFQNMERNSNPWGIGWSARAEWAEGLDIKILADDSNVDILFWVGCAGSFDDRNKKVSKSLVRIMNAAGVNFGILGTEEKCTGDSARRIGNEYLFQMLAQENVETLNRYNIKKIVTACPHCYNTLKNEYPQFGGNYDVQHATEFIASLIDSGKLKLTNEISRTIAYHDSCYLGRYNDVYDAPRRILQAIPGVKLVEIDRHGDRSFCCGAGGGRMWMEEHIGQRINVVRTEQALETKPDAIGTACPFCLTMFDEGVKVKEVDETVKAEDVIELVDQALG